MSCLLCTDCKNLAQKITDGISLKFQCLACNKEYKGKEVDSLIYAKKKSKTVVYRDGRLIFGNDANPRMFKTCPICKKELIIAWEIINEDRIYGCKCGCSFNENGVTLNEPKTS